MTREEILDMEPGQELSELVTVHVMDYEVGVVSLGHWEPSEDISASWEVEERIASRKDQGWYVRALCDIVGTPRDGTRTLAMDDWRLIHATPEQRCKAALLAVLNL